jgi:hypothetical protein
MSYPAGHAEESPSNELDWITGRKSLAGLFLLLLIAIGWSSAPFFRPGVLNGERFVFHDNSYALFLVDQLLAGKLLFRDVFYQYGVLTAYVHAGWAALFGNTIFSYWHLAQLLTCVGVIQLWILLRRSQSAWQALAFGTIVLFPYFLVPGGSAGGVGASVYVGLERICLLSIALAWRPPTSRSLASALSLGVLLGLMQSIKFGGAFIAGISLLAIDALVLSYASVEKKRWLRWLQLSFVTLIGFLVIEGSLIVLAYLSLPAQLASEVLWPSWMVQNYEAYRHKSVPLWHWFNLNYFLGTQLPVFAAALAAPVFIARLLFMRKVTGPGEQSWLLRLAGPPLFFVIFFLFALILYLPHMWVAMPYVWLILLPAAFFLHNVPLFVRSIFLVSCFPAFFLSVKGVVYPRSAEQLQEVHLVKDTLWLSPEAADRLTKLQHVLELLDQRPGGFTSGPPAILGFPMGSGLHHFLGYPAATRHVWFMSGFVRPHEEDILVKSLDRTLAVIVFFADQPHSDPPSPDPSTWEFFSIPLFTRSTCLAFASRLQHPIKVDSQCWVFPVMTKDGPAISR